MYALLLFNVAQFILIAGLFIYIGHAIQENNRPLCRLTVKIEDNGVNPEIKKEVTDINKEHNCRELVRNG